MREKKHKGILYGPSNFKLASCIHLTWKAQLFCPFHRLENEAKDEIHVKGRFLVLLKMKGFWVTGVLNEGYGKNYRKLPVLSTFNEQICRKMTLNHPQLPNLSQQTAKEIKAVRIWLTNKSPLYFSCHPSLSMPLKQRYLIWSLFNDP